MKQTHRFAVLALALVLLLVACTPGAEVGVAQSQAQRVPLPDVPDADLHELVAGNNALAFDLYQAVRGEENLFFSPYSISTALAMTYAGARGNTERQMADVFHFTLPQEQLHPAFNALDLAIARGGGEGKTAEEEEFVLNVANSLWGQQGYPFLPDFLDLLAENYGAGLRLVDFKSAPEPARIAINEWVSDQTEDRIKDLIPEGAITDLTRLVLANAIYFDAKWIHPFDTARTRDEVFNLLDGEQVSVPMMSMSDPADLLYAQGSGYQAVELPYRGGRAAMTIIVPDSGSFVDLESALSADQIDTILASMEYASVALTLPKFSYEQSISMARALADMGMPDAMDPKLADLSGMDGTQDLYITDVFHKAFVAVDEAGTEAAAATAVIVGIESAPVIDVEFTVDRPFVFLIRDIETNSILFLGRVLNPAE